MKNNRYFQTRIGLLGIAAALLGAAALVSVGFVTFEYEKLVERIRDRGLFELQRYQNVEREVAGTHLNFIQLMADKHGPGDEQRLYAEGKKIADALDHLIARYFGEQIAPGRSPTQIDQEFREAIVRYRSDVLLSLEMMTVNPRLSERYLLRSAITLSQLNIAIAKNFETRRVTINEDMSATRYQTSREIVVLIAIMLLIVTAVLFAILRLTHRLTLNFRSVENTLLRLESHSPHGSDLIGVVDGEFKAIADSLSRFQSVLTERDFTRSQMLAIFESILEAVVVIDDHGRIIQTNPMVTKLFGYSQAELVGKNVKILTPPEIEANHDRYLKRYRTTGVAGGIVGKIRTTEGRHRGGRLFPIQLAVSEVFVGDVRYFVGVISDITERIENEQLLREARDAALSSSRLKAEFLATMSHEIRTPMNGILGMAQLLVDNGITDEERRRCARILLGSCETLITLLNDILDLSKIEAGKLTFNLEATSPVLLAEQTAALFVEAANAKGLQLNVFSPLSAHNDFMLDPTRVRQMLSNLVGNAVKFSETGQIRIESSLVQDEHERDMLVFRVTDSGPGIAPEEVSRLFGKYSQLDNSSTRRHGGSGLGLSIVRQLAHALQGDVGVESTPGKGSTFWFSLPAIKPVETAPLHNAQEQSVSAPRTRKGNPPLLQGRALIAEDTTANQIFMQLALKRLGVDSVLVGNGHEAVNTVIRDGPFDCIFMDMRMPAMDGEEATHLIRQWELSNSRPRCPIIAVTANAYDDDRHLCQVAGMDDFVAKPVKVSELRRVLERWLPPANRKQADGTN